MGSSSDTNQAEELDAEELESGQLEEKLEIDYLHPDGKPVSVCGGMESDGKPDLRSYRRALQEADGHSMKKHDPFLHNGGAPL